MYALLGNASAIESKKTEDEDGTPSLEQRPIEGRQVTTFEFPEGISLGDALLSVRDAWRYHSANDAPDWVESDNEVLATLLGGEYDCPTTRPDDWE